MQNLSFNQLKQELAYCDNPIRERLIRKLMYLKYTKKINQQKSKLNIDISDLEIQNNESEDDSSTKMKEKLNSQMLQRMDANIDLHKKSTNKKINCLPPYIDSNDNKYASFDEAFNTNLSSFSDKLNG